MDTEWLSDRLNDYLRAFRLATTDPRYDWTQADALDVELPTVKRILKHLGETYVTVGDANNRSTYQNVARAVNRAIGALRDHGVLEEMLRPDSPQFDAASLHPWTWDSAQGLWFTGHYREAVQAACTAVNAHLQSLSARRDVSDLKLVNELFSDRNAEPGRPRLRWPGDERDEEVRSMVSGLRSFAAGCFQTIRNRATHDLEELTEQQALERLAALSLLCHWIENCELVVHQEPSAETSLAKLAANDD